MCQAGACQFCALGKGIGTARWLANSSWPGVNTWGAYVGKVPLASNFATLSKCSDRFEWLGVRAIGQGLQALLEVRGLGEGTRGVKVVGRVHHATKYFWILAFARADRWRASIMIGGKFVEKTKMTIGHRTTG